MTGQGEKASKSRFQIDTRKTFFTMSMVRHWRRLSREDVDAASLEVLFKARLDGALSNLIYRKEVSLPISELLELGDLKGPFQPKPYCVSMIYTQTQEPTKYSS